MKFKFLLLLNILFINFSFGQDRTFSYVGKYTNENKLKAIADSLNQPLLVSGDNIYSVGSDCITRLLDGDINDRNKNGIDNDRDKEGSNDERNKGGDVADRKKRGNKNARNKNSNDNDRNMDGNNDDRNKGGDIADRNKKGNKNKRNNAGDDNDRDKDGDQDSRNADGAIGNGPRCSSAKNGKILLYTRQDINSKNSNLYYKGKFFDNKYFKIIQL